jgi:signal-transduction protein with cAMP-binding, CBS, and nucleotidyltransferase domain
MAAKLDYTKNQIAQQIVQQWGDLTDEQYNLLLRNITIRRYKKNDYIYRDFESPNLALYLIHGKVKIFKDGI